ncbi:MAG: Alpha/beta hydrolase family protein [Methanoregula sp. PtaU1.Bin051]|nr:MAG: Alpha/beta hydrolase family protein [Methanoregula sp. PtaU1.Bin051]
MTDYVLVHGGNMSTETWNRLTVGKPVHSEDGRMGGMIWDGTVVVLKAAGHRAFAPTLHDERTGTLTGHIGEVCTLIKDNYLRDIILTGHSYGGMVITGVADRMPDRIRRMVYLDAALPEPGQSLYDILRQGLSFAPGMRAVLPEPDPPYVEQLQFDPARLQPILKTYILCTKSEFSAVTRIAKEKIARIKKGWDYFELPSSHVPMADMPDEFNRLMLNAAKK